MKKFLLLSHICGTFWRIYGWLPGWFPCQCKPVTQLRNALLYIIGPGISGMTIAYARWLIRNFGALVKFTVDYSAINEYMYVYIMESVLEARLEFVWIEPKDFHLFLDWIKRRSSAALSRRESFWLQKANTNIFGYGSTINRLPRRGYSWSHPSRYWTDIWKAMEGNKELLRTSLQIQKYVPFPIWHLQGFLGNHSYSQPCFLSSEGYLQGLGQQVLTNDIRSMLTADDGLRFASQRYYLQGRKTMGDVSDFSDFSD